MKLLSLSVLCVVYSWLTEMNGNCILMISVDIHIQGLLKYFSMRKPSYEYAIFLLHTCIEYYFCWGKKLLLDPIDIAIYLIISDILFYFKSPGGKHWKEVFCSISELNWHLVCVRKLFPFCFISMILHLLI